MRNVIGLDPSLTNTGICAVDLDSEAVIAWKCIRTDPDPKLKATEDLARRLRVIAREVRNFCTMYPGVVIIEGQVGSGFGKGSGMGSVGLLMAAYGAALAALPNKPVVLHSSTIKSRLLPGQKFRSPKESKAAAWEAAQKVLKHLPDEPKTKPAREAVHDAAATAVAGMPEVDQLLALVGQQ